MRLFLILLTCLICSSFAHTSLAENVNSNTTTVFSCDGKNAMDKFYWDVYLTAVKNVQPYLQNGDPLIIFGWKTGGRIKNYIPSCTFSYLIITKSGKCYLLEKCPDVLSNYIDHKANYLVDLYSVSEIKKLFQCDGYDFFEDMFDASQYCDGITTNLDNPSDVPYFYAMFDEKEQIHGATIISIDQVPYFNKNYISAMFVALFKSIERIYLKKSWEDMGLTDICICHKEED